MSKILYPILTTLLDRGPRLKRSPGSLLKALGLKPKASGLKPLYIALGQKELGLRALGLRPEAVGLRINI